MQNKRKEDSRWRRAWVAGAWALATLFAAETKIASADIYTYVDKDGVTHFTNVAKKGEQWKVYLKGNASKKSATSGPSGAITPYRSPNGGGADRYTRYDTVIREAAAYYQIPEALVRAVIKVESDFDPAAR